MVTKPERYTVFNNNCLILAKIHMVTKRCARYKHSYQRLILAKIHMVTKPTNLNLLTLNSLILAKIHMVTKLDVCYFFI